MNEDPFGGSRLGGFNTPLSQDPQTASRSYAANAYYKPNAGRSNMKVLTSSMATKVIFKGHNNSEAPMTATGVNFTNEGESYVVEAKREVILSASTLR